MPLALAAALLAGCSQTPSRARPPIIDAAESGRQAIALYDTNADGELDDGELAAVPGIRQVLSAYDRDGNKRISAEEIAARIGQWQADDTGLAMLSCVLYVDRRPLEGALVRLVPEPFLGDDIRPASTVTGGGGQGIMKIADEDLPRHLRGVRGVALGVYKVEVTHPTDDLPARYNSATELGLEVGHDSPEASSGRFTLSLSSRK